jgi:hypothetical protein
MTVFITGMNRSMTGPVRFMTGLVRPVPTGVLFGQVYLSLRFDPASGSFNSLA